MTTYSYDVPLDWKSALNEIQHRMAQAVGQLECIEVQRLNGSNSDFHKGEQRELYNSLFNIAHTDAISRIVIEQYHERYRLKIVTVVDSHDTNITPELMNCLAKILNKADMRRDVNWERIRQYYRQVGSTYNPFTF